LGEEELLLWSCGKGLEERERNVVKEVSDLIEKKMSVRRTRILDCVKECKHMFTLSFVPAFLPL
jgi:hypothetical protein